MPHREEKVPSPSHSPVEVFYSYAREDEELCLELDKHLSLLHRQGRISSWHPHHIVPGTDWAQDIGAHLDRAYLILLLISADFLASDYNKGEMERALERHAIDNARVIPILVRPVHWKGAPFEHLQMLPTNAKPITSWPNRDEAFADIAAGIRRTLDGLPLLAASAPTTYILPQQDIPDFTGRVTELRRLEQQLLSPDKPRIAAIVGTAGMGKSALAVHFAKKHQHHFPDGILGLRVDRPEEKKGDAEQEALEIAQKFASCARAEIDPSQRLSAQEIMQVIFGQRRMLLIFDGAEDIDIVGQLLPGEGQCTVIVTSRNRALLDELHIPTGGHIDLPEFTYEETRILLSQFLGTEYVDMEHGHIQELHTLVGGLPLALRIVGGTLRKRSVIRGSAAISIGEYVAQLREEKQQLLKSLENRWVKTVNVRASFRLSLPALEAEPKNLRLFACLGACAPEGWSRSTAQVVSDLPPNDVENGLEDLYYLSLVNLGIAGRMTLHPLLYIFARKLGDELGVLREAEQRHTDHFVRYAQERSDPSAAKKNELIQEFDALVVTAERLVMDLDRAIDFYLLLEPILEEGRWARALKLLDLLIGAAESQRNTYAHVYFLLQQGQFLRLAAQYKEAEQVLLKGGEMALHVENNTKRQFLIAMMWNKLGGLYRDQGKLVEAEEVLGKSLAIYMGVERQRTGMVLNSLGGVYQAQGRLQEAEQALQESLDIEQAFANRRGMGMVFNSLGGVYQAQGRLQEAEQALLKSLEIRQEFDDRRGMGIVLHSLGRVYKAQDKYEEAVQALQQSLEIEQASNNRRGMGIVLHSLGRVYKAQGKYEEAVQTLQQSLNIGKELGDRRHMGMVLNSLGIVYLAQSKFEQASIYLKESFLIREKLNNAPDICKITTLQKPSAKAPVFQAGDEAPFLVRGG